MANDGGSRPLDGRTAIVTGSGQNIGKAIAQHFAAAGDSSMVAVLSTELDEQLRDEGFYRELLHRIQNLRKETDIEYTRRIELSLEGSERLARIVGDNREHLMSETLCTNLRDGADGTADGIERAFEIDGERIRLVMETV